ncbi:MAG TPA: DsrE family protein [Gemmatimonadaceae bacterium]|jgi:DsrE/DsrF-like family.
MRWLGCLAAVAAAVIVAAPATSAQAIPGMPAGEYPVIKGFSPAYPLPKAAAQPSKTAHYKVIFNIAREAANVDDPNPGLLHIARFLNVYAAAGVPVRSMELVAVISGPATHVALDGASFRARERVDNPNLDLIHQLRGAGVMIYVCGQSLVEQGFTPKQVSGDVTLALSALTMVPEYVGQGYTVLQY